MKPQPDPSIDARFTLESVVGRGAFGEVYRARDVETGATVAVKRLGGVLTDSAATERFEREARLLARVDSSNVVRYVAHGSDREGRAWLVIEWLDGEDLGRRRARGPISAPDAVEIVRQAALGLAALHDAGIVHRDIKPSNVFLVASAGGGIHVKLVDLGIARAHTEVSITLDGSRIGTPSYMSPEQARGDEHVPAQSDLFSLGVVLYEMLAGRRPFTGGDPFAVLAKIVLEDPPRLGALVSNAPTELDAVIERALAKSPDDRFASARDMATALAALPTWDASGPHESSDAPTSRLHPADSSSPPLERRVVTAVFAGFAGLGAWETAQREFAAIAARHGGIVHRTLGRRMIAVFGVARSTGDEPVRAARAALAIREAFPGVRIAICTGRALAGTAGLSGDAIDRGTRDVERTRGAVRVDPATARLLAGSFTIEGDEGEQVLSAESDVLSDIAPTFLGHTTSMVGRERELESLEDLMVRVSTEKRPAAAVVLGPPGIGKSRLRFELLARAAARVPDAVRWAIRGDPLQSDVPLGCLSRALRNEAGIDPGSPRDAQRSRVRTWVAEAAIEADPALVGELLRVEFAPESSPALAMARADPGVMRNRLRETLAAVLDARARSGLAVVSLDDLQWLDSATIDALAWCLDVLGGAPLLLVAFGRPEAVRRFPGLWSSASPLSLQLGPLASRAAESWVRSTLAASAGESVVRSVVERAGGNPLFIEELLRAVQTGDESGLPVAIQAAFQIRLDSLAPATKRAALVGSVFGTAVWRDALAALLPAVDVDAALGALVRAEVLAERPRSRFVRAKEFVYRHTLLRDAAYAMLPSDELTRLHRAAAEWLILAGENDDAVIARHLDLGGEPARAVESYLVAARRAERESAFESALAHAERALTLGAEGEERAEVHAIAAHACHPLGRYAEAISHGEAGLALTSDPARKLDLLANRGLTLRRTGAGERAREELSAAIGSNDETAHDPAVLRARTAVRIELAWNLLSAGRSADAEALARRVLETATEGRGPAFAPLRLSALHALARAQHGLGDLETSARTHRDAITQSRASGNLWRSGGAQYGLGQVLLALGENDEARRVLASTRDEAKLLRFPSTEGYASLYLAIAQGRAGAYALARAEADRAAALGEQLAAPALHAGGLALAAEFAARLGDHDAVNELAARAMAIDAAPRWCRALARAIQGRRALEASDADAARAFLADAVRIAGEELSSDDESDLARVAMLHLADALDDAPLGATLRDRWRTRLRDRLDRVTDEARRRSMKANVPVFAVVGV